YNAGASTCNELFLDTDLSEFQRVIDLNVATRMNMLPVPWVDPVDVANASLFLASDEARYITSVSLPVDAGATQR
ncbi:SDR family oxidoreductase, partial [Mycolicibacterium gadium]|uniref:SDR family oxidoreductase n=1 Tax=Mycolicibacterium gadium TaxID=1794 RepID=UPI0021F36BF1